MLDMSRFTRPDSQGFSSASNKKKKKGRSVNMTLLSAIFPPIQNNILYNAVYKMRDNMSESQEIWLFLFFCEILGEIEILQWKRNLLLLFSFSPPPPSHKEKELLKIFNSKCFDNSSFSEIVCLRKYFFLPFSKRVKCEYKWKFSFHL